MTATRTTTVKSLDEKMAARIRHAMHMTWNAIGGDCIDYVGEMSQAAVIEVVLDAGHAEGYGNDPEAVAVLRTMSYTEMKKFGRTVFCPGRYL